MDEHVGRAADVLLSDGTTVHLRPIQPSDADRIVALHSRLSERTRYLRFFSPYPRIPQRDLHRFVNVDHRDREAYVVELGGDLVAVGRYERLGDHAPDAEVAFVVEDAHQGRGIGSVLIEHLVAAAREVGIREFVADVLPQNHTMLRVFADAGFRIERELSDGVIHLWFAIAPTADTVRVQARREQRAEARSIARLLAPRGVAVYGVRADGSGVGATVLAHLRLAGFAGPIVPVHPSASLVADLSTVDLAVVAVPADAVPDVVADCAAAGVHGLVVISAGYAERDATGAQAEADLVRTVRGHGMRLVGPNCLGIANTDPGVRLNATLAPTLPPPGNVGFFSQSAALGTALLAEASRRGLGLSSFVSAGNRADVSGNDLLQYWRDDPRTDAVLLYLETFGNPRKFARIARELGRRKPVVAVASVVRDAVGTGPDPRGVAALFASSGVIRVDTVGELFDVGLLLAKHGPPSGDRLAVVTNAAALGVLALGQAPAAGLRVADGYPRDVGPLASPPEYVDAVLAALDDSGADVVVAAYAPVDLDGVSAVGDGLRERAPRGRPLALVLPSTVDGFARYPTVEEAVRAIGHVVRYAAWRREPSGVEPKLSDVDVAAASRLVESLVDGTGEHEDAERVDALLACYGIEVVPRRRADGDSVREVAAAFGVPVAVKVARTSLRHRPDLGAVRLDLATPDAVANAYRELERLFGTGTEVIVQPMVPPGVACVVEVVDDPAFGPVVGFGLGGEAVELLGDRAWRPAPLTDRDAEALVRAPRAAPLLMGYRGAEPVDLPALVELLLRVGQLVHDQPALSRLTLNPVLARAAGLSVLHAAATFVPHPTRPDTGPRRLG